MNPHQALVAAMVAALKGHGAFASGVTGVFDAPPVRAMRPYALVEEPVLTDWSTKDREGWEARLSVQLRGVGERRAGLRALADAVGPALAGLAPEGWQVASLVAVRSRVLADGDGGLTAVVEHRVRMLRAG